MIEPLPIPGPRIAVIGVTGSGKTTTSLRLSRILGIPHVELDSLHWLPGWQASPTDIFRARVSEALSAPDWITDGNYSKARDIIWSRAVTIVWLDYSLPVILSQLFQRTLKRIVSREELWNGNRETWRGTFLSKDSLFLWALQTYPRYKLAFPQLLAQPENTHLQLIHLHTRRETQRWLERLAGQGKAIESQEKRPLDNLF